MPKSGEPKHAVSCAELPPFNRCALRACPATFAGRHAVWSLGNHSRTICLSPAIGAGRNAASRKEFGGSVTR